MEYNPYLGTRPLGGRGGVEKIENVPWQSRAEPPDEFENRLGDALERIFLSGAQTLGEVMHRLNEDGTHDRAGRAWTEDILLAELQRLGS